MTGTPAQAIDAARRRKPAALLLVVAAVLLAAALAPSGAAAKTRWLCKPGAKPNPCKGSLRTTVFAGDGSSTVETPRNARRPDYDCFYVYPTVSGQPGENANKDIDPEQIAIAQQQAARYSMDCKVYAPVYRQLTLTAINSPGGVSPEAQERAYRDVLKAWRTYLRRHNNGRGVVLIGHSQGAFMLERLIRERVEKRRSQRRKLISAILLGGNVAIRKGSDVGGSFRRTPVCRSERQLGCVIAFSVFNETPPANARFGRTTSGFSALPPGKDPADYRVACTNPASLGGGSAPVETIVRTEPFPGLLGVGLTIMYGGPTPTAATPWLIPEDHYAARCDRSGGASSLMISPIDGAKTLNPSPDATWGLHLIDANVALGNLIDLVHNQGKHYLKRG